MFDGKGEWSFGNDYARNVIMFGVDNSSSSHADNIKKIILVLVEVVGINGRFGTSEKILVLILIKQTQNFAWVYIIMLIIVISLLMEKILKFKADNKNVNFPTQFCLGSISDGFSNNESREVFLNGNVYDFSVNYNFIDESDILCIYKYLITKNNVI